MIGRVMPDGVSDSGLLEIGGSRVDRSDLNRCRPDDQRIRVLIGNGHGAVVALNTRRQECHPRHQEGDEDQSNNRGNLAGGHIADVAVGEVKKW